jgi:hypothetical protein
MEDFVQSFHDIVDICIFNVSLIMQLEKYTPKSLT